MADAQRRLVLLQTFRRHLPNARRNTLNHLTRITLRRLLLQLQILMFARGLESGKLLDRLLLHLLVPLPRFDRFVARLRAFLTFLKHNEWFLFLTFFLFQHFSLNSRVINWRQWLYKVKILIEKTPSCDPFYRFE